MRRSCRTGPVPAPYAGGVRVCTTTGRRTRRGRRRPQDERPSRCCGRDARAPPHGVGPRVPPCVRSARPRGLGPGGEARRARPLPVHPRRLRHDVHRPALDDAPVRRVRHGRGVQRPLPPADRGGHGRSFGGVRPADADGLRLRRARGARGGRQGGRRDRLDRRHAAPVRRHPAGRGVDVDDDQRAGGVVAAAVPARGRGARGVAGPAERHHPERRPEGVHRAGHLHLPAETFAAAGLRHLRLLSIRACAVQHDLHLGLPHGRGRCDARAGDRVHARERHRVRPCRTRRGPRGRRVRAAAVVLLRGPYDAARGGREVPGGAADLGAGDARASSVPRTPSR